MGDAYKKSQEHTPRKLVPKLAGRTIQILKGDLLLDSKISHLAVNAFSLAATGYASAFSGVRRSQFGDLVVFTGLPHWAYPRGGICIAEVFLTGPKPSESVLKHELEHLKQWRRYGLAFPFLYWKEGRNPFHNRFEIEAGLGDGGYT